MAFTEEYLTYRKNQEAVFCPNYLQDEIQSALSLQYSIKKRHYRGEVGKYTLHATENDVFDQNGNLLYTFRNINDSCEFHKIIEHSDSNNYLLFRTDLYGYSILNLTTFQDFHYIPSGSFPEGETFIWTDITYNSDNNIVAVTGCYWACPFGTLLQDFSNPMCEPEVWVDVQKNIENGYDQYDDVDFLEWRGTDLVLSALNCETSEKEILSIIQEQYKTWLKKKSV